MKKIAFENLRFCLLPSANPPQEITKLHNSAFKVWSDVWTGVFNELKFDTSRMNDDFIRQDLIAAVFDGDTPAAVHLYSFFSIDCDASRAHGYLNGNFPQTYFEKLAQNKIRNVMSMEYMTIHPDYRKSKVDIHLGAALVGLAAWTMRHFGADAAIAPARRDHKVHDLVYAVGGESVISNVVNHNVACDLLMCRRENVKAHDSPDVQKLIEFLWAKREYHATCTEAAPNNVLPFPELKQAA